MTVKDGQVFYQSRITESSRYKGQGSSDKKIMSGYCPFIPVIVYEREGKVCRPEVGTYREDDWVTEEYEGEPINDHDPLKSWKIMKNRMKFLVEEQYATDNTNIGKVKITSSATFFTLYFFLIFFS